MFDRISCGLSLPVILLAFISADLQAAGEKVGAVGDPAALHIFGTTTFSSEQIMASLGTDPEMLLAGHPSAPRARYLQTVKSRIEAGYRRAGFVDVEVKVEISSIRKIVAVQVIEGKRRYKNQIVVETETEVDIQRVIDALQSEFVPLNAVSAKFSTEGDQVVGWVDEDGKEAQQDPILWKPREPARFDQEFRKRVSRRVSNALEADGYESPEVSAEVIANDDDKTARLVVHVIKLGGRSTLQRIEVKGNKSHTSEQIIEYLNLETGKPFTRRDFTQAVYSLWSSGRFIDFDAKTTTNLGEMTLSIDAEEIEGATLLGQPFSPNEQALLKLRDWIRSQKSEVTFEASTDEATLEVILQPKRGWIICAQPTKDEASSHVMIVSDNSVTYMPPSRDYYYSAAIGGQVSLAANFTTLRDPNGMNSKVEFALGAKSSPKEASSKRGETQGLQSELMPLQVAINMSPSSCVLEAHRKGTQFKRDHSKLTIDGVDGVQVTIVEKTGTLIECKLGEMGHLRATEGRYKKRHAEINKQIASVENRYSESRPVSSTLKFLIHDLGSQLPDSVRNKIDIEWPQLAVLVRILDADALASVDEAVIEHFIQKTDLSPFKLPHGNYRLGNTSQLAIASPFMVQAAELAFPRQSWPWTLTRESAFMLGGMSRYLREELEKYAFANGPLALLAAGKVTTYLGGNTTKILAHYARRQMSKKRFMDDLAPLLDQKHLCGSCVLGVAESLRKIDEDSLATFATSISTDFDQLIVNLGARLRKTEGPLTEHKLAEAIGEAWDDGLATWVEAELQRMAPAGLGRQ